jgi:hypothetical protein
MYTVKVDVALWMLQPRPIPLLRIERGPQADKPLSAILGEYVGRVLAAMPAEAQWPVSVGRFSENIGIVTIDVFRGDRREIDSALNALRAVVAN